MFLFSLFFFVFFIFRFPKVRIIAAEQLYSFLLLLPPATDVPPSRDEQQTVQNKRHKHLAFSLKQRQIDEAVEILISTPWAQLPGAEQQQLQQQQQQLQQQDHPCMQLVTLLGLEREAEELRLP